MRITNDTPESELPNGAEIHVIDRERVIIIPSHLDPRTIPSQSARSQVQGGPSTLSAVPTAPVPRPGHQKAFVYRQSNILREVGPDPTGIKAQVAKAQAEAMAEFGQRELRGKGRTAASPEDLEMARRIVDTGEHSSGEGASAKKVRTVIEVESMEKAFPYLHLITEGEPNADVAAPEPEKGKSKSSGFKDPIALQQGNATASSSKWVKDRDIKPVNDHNETGSNAWGSDVPEGFARHSFSSDQEPWKDEDNEVEGDVRHQLADWSGNMAPAPVEWDSRSAYNNQSPQHAKSIDKWVAENGWNKAGEVVDTSDPRFLDSRPGHESALTFVVDGATLQEPEKLEPTKRDMDDKLTLEHANERAETLVENWVANKNKLITDEEELRNFQRAMYWKVHNEYVPGPNPHAPKANIYLRPATALDVEQIGIIMNYYVLSSCSRVETKEFSAEALGSSIAMSTEVDGLPYIVAVLRIPPKDKKQREKQQIVGVAYANHLGNDQSDAYRYTVEFNLFVHPQHKRQGVGKSLMDMMIHVLDPYYLPRQGYVFQYDKETEHRYVAGGGKWGLKKICVLMPFDADDTAEYETVKKWLEKEWEFEEEAILKHHGYKFKMPSKV
jgi:L-amino acid N-acyltransferase YncA